VRELDGYTLVTDLDVPASAYDDQGHLNNVAVLELFEKLRRQYMLQKGRLRREHIPQGYVVGVREMVCSYVSEAMPGEPLRGGCRVVGRHRRSYLFDEIIVAAGMAAAASPLSGERVVARGRFLEVVIDRAQAKAVEIPETLWSYIEAVEGRRMEPGPRPFPRTEW
jgi:acyl-CoA thioesterase FadM